MNFPKINEAIPLIGTTLGGVIIGVFAANGFTALGWELEWETLAAGALGLAGGWLAYKAATDHRRATENRNEYIFRARHLQELVTARELLDMHEPLSYGKKTAILPRLDTGRIVTILNKAACFAEPLPASITKELEHLCEALPLFEMHAKMVWWTMKSDTSTTVKIGDPISMARSYKGLKKSVDKLITHIALGETRK